MTAQSSSVSETLEKLLNHPANPLSGINETVQSERFEDQREDLVDRLREKGAGATEAAMVGALAPFAPEKPDSTLDSFLSFGIAERFDAVRNVLNGKHFYIDNKPLFYKGERHAGVLDYLFPLPALLLLAGRALTKQLWKNPRLELSDSDSTAMRRLKKFGRGLTKAAIVITRTLGALTQAVKFLATVAISIALSPAILIIHLALKVAKLIVDTHREKHADQYPNPYGSSSYSSLVTPGSGATGSEYGMSGAL